jgi:hypothetical protein
MQRTVHLARKTLSREHWIQEEEADDGDRDSTLDTSKGSVQAGFVESNLDGDDAATRIRE